MVERGARNVKPAETFGPGDQAPNYMILPPRRLNIYGGSITVPGATLLSDMFDSGALSGVVIWHSVATLYGDK
jgi:hypothetical protein